MFLFILLDLLIFLIKKTFKTNNKRVFSNLSLLHLQKEFKYKIASARKPININVICIICHFILIIFCINYLNENRSIELEKRGVYGENPCFCTNKNF